MTSPTRVVGFPARGARDWEGRRAWGRDAHLLEAMARCAGEGLEPVAVLRTRRLGGSVPTRMALGCLEARVVAHRVEVPAWTRRRLPAALARRWADAPPAGIPEAGGAVVLCSDLLRHGAARELAAGRGWPLVTDLMDDWRHHESMPAWRRHLAEEVLPAIPGPGELLTSVTATAAHPRAALVVPNAGHHEDDPEEVPSAGPGRPVAAFVGTIHPRLDAGALVALARALPAWDVVAVGPVMDPAVARRLADGGVRLEPWWDLRRIDDLATVVVAPYTDSRLALTGDPLKIYEATARGVPCVSSVPVGMPPEVGLTVVGGAQELADAVAAAARVDRVEIARAARATGSWEDRARTILAALDVGTGARATVGG